MNEFCLLVISNSTSLPFDWVSNNVLAINCWVHANECIRAQLMGINWYALEIHSIVKLVLLPHRLDTAPTRLQLQSGFFNFKTMEHICSHKYHLFTGITPINPFLNEFAATADQFSIFFHRHTHFFAPRPLKEPVLMYFYSAKMVSLS